MRGRTPSHGTQRAPMRGHTPSHGTQRAPMRGHTPSRGTQRAPMRGHTPSRGTQRAPMRDLPHPLLWLLTSLIPPPSPRLLPNLHPHNRNTLPKSPRKTPIPPPHLIAIPCPRHTQYLHPRNPTTFPPLTHHFLTRHFLLLSSNSPQPCTIPPTNSSTARSSCPPRLRSFSPSIPRLAAWSSLTFGLPGQGISIDHEDPALTNSADFLIALSHGPGKTVALPFVGPATAADYEGQHARGADSAAKASGSYRDRFTFLKPEEVTRTLSPCVDTFSSATISLSVYTPFPSIPNPKRSSQPQFSVCPGILMEVTFDNSASDQPATGFIGLGYHGRGRIRPMDWSTNGALAGVGFASSWALAALPAAHISTLRDNSIAEHVELGTPLIHNGGQEGGILVKIAPHQKLTIPVTFAFYHGGNATQGIDGSYYYTQFFLDLEAVANFTLRNVGKIKESCTNLDAKISALAPDPAKQAAIGQGLRGYNANSQLIISNNIPYFSVMAGQFTWRNSLDLAVDHLPWELYRNTWTVRNIFDLYSAHYSYRDELSFPGEDAPSIPAASPTPTMSAPAPPTPPPAPAPMKCPTSPAATPT